MRRVPATLCTVDPVLLLGLGYASSRPLGRIRCHAVLPQVLGKLASPFAQSGFSDVQPGPVVSHCLDDHVHVGVRLVGVKHHGVPVLRPKLLPSEVLDGRQDLIRRRPRRHREDHLVHQLRLLAHLPGLVVRRRRPLGIQFQVPVIEERLGNAFTLEGVAVIGLDGKLPVPVQVLQVSGHGT